MRKLKRTPAYNLTLEISDPAFIRPPADAQRNWLLNRLMNETAADLQALDELAPQFVPGASREKEIDFALDDLTDDEIMEDWQIPLMRRMAEIATASGGHVLEVGFGRGVSADFIQAGGPRAHTIVECNDAIVRRYEVWREQYPGADIRLLHGLWQDMTGQFEQYDSIFFHTYPLDQEEYAQQVLRATTFAEHFFPTAAAHLVDGGVFTYLTNEIDSFSRAHQRLVFDYFSSFTLEEVPLALPPDVHDAWWSNQMLVIRAVK